MIHQKITASWMYFLMQSTVNTARLSIGTGNQRQHLKMFILHFLNKDVSIDIASNSAKFLGNVLYILFSEARLQILIKALLYLFMLYRNV